MRGLLAALIIFSCLSAYAEERYAIELSGPLKHKFDFKHFDNVNPYAPKGGEIRLNHPADFISLNPLSDKNPYTTPISEFSLETLMVQSPDELKALYCHICSSYKVTDNGFLATFAIKANVTFSDGSKLNAHDVAGTISNLASKGPLLYRLYLKDLEYAKALNDHTIEYRFKANPQEMLLKVVSTPILKKDFIDNIDINLFEGIMIGSGPYVVDSYKYGNYLRLKRNPNYWAQNEPTAKGMYNFDYLHYSFITDRSIEIEAFLGKQIDFRMEMTSKNWEFAFKNAMAREPDLKMVERENLSNQIPAYIAINTQGQFTKDKAVRFAVAMAFDVDFIIKNYLFNKAKAIDNIYITTPMFDENYQAKFLLNRSANDPNKQRYFLEQAKSELQANGYSLRDNKLYQNNEQVILKMLIVDRALYRIAHMLKHNLSQLGIELQVITVDESTYERKLTKGEYDLVYSGGRSFFNKALTEKIIFNKATIGINSSNISRVVDNKLEQLIDRLASAKDENEIKRIANAINDRVVGEYYLIPSYYSPYFRYTFWDKLSMPEYQSPYEVGLSTWWIKQ